ncbi:MAG: hypothetical protein AAGJ35_02885 [Myxococcota bacterium]
MSAVILTSPSNCSVAFLGRRRRKRALRLLLRVPWVIWERVCASSSAFANLSL